MSHLKITGAALAFAAASMFTTAPAFADTNDGQMIHCKGGNSCKGQSACNTAKTSCKGQNSCKGQGWAVMSRKDCAKAGGTVMNDSDSN